MPIDNAPISYKIDNVRFCCEDMKYFLYKGSFLYDGVGVHPWGDKTYFDNCPFCGKRGLNVYETKP